MKSSYCPPFFCRARLSVAYCCALALVSFAGLADDWPRWRGVNGSGVSAEKNLPWEWSGERNVRWKTTIPGEGSSSPIVIGERVFVTSSVEGGLRRSMHCLDRKTGDILWTRTIDDPDPEVASSLTGHAASTPCSDGRRVVTWFGRAGLVAWDASGRELWRMDTGPLESELGFASSPIIHGDLAILVCDHDGDRFSSQESYLLAVELASGKVRYKTPRTGLNRSWATPIVASTGQHQELIVSAQDQLRGYDANSGKMLWHVDGMTGWVAPSPIFADGLIVATCGRSGPVLAIRPGGEGDVTKSHVAWRHETGGPYVCSPVCYQGYLYVHDETGVLSCFQADSGRLRYRERLEGKFTASSVAGDGRVYLTNDEGTTYVVKVGPKFELVATNRLDESCLSSIAIAGKAFFLRTNKHLYCIGESADK